MKTAFVGAGPGCRAVLELFQQGRLPFLNLEILAVVDLDPRAEGMRFAREQGWRTLTRIDDALALDGLQLVIELTGRDEVLEEIYQHLPSGVRVMDHVMARVFWDLDEVFQYLSKQLEDKTRLENRVQADRARLQEILDSLPDVVMVMNPDMRIARVNRRFEEVTKTPWQVACGKYCYEAFCLNNRLLTCHEAECPFINVMRTREPFTAVHRSGQGEGYYQVTAVPVFDAQGEIVRVVETSREITEQVLLKQETELSARRFQEIVGAVHGIITIKDQRGRFQFVNPRAEQFLGMTRKELVGRRAAEVLPSEVAAIMEKHEREALRKGDHVVHTETVRLGGKEHQLVCERFPMTDYQGRVTGVCCVARDDTRQQELRREVLQSERLAAVGKLAAGVAHELNNPLTGILTFAEDLMLEADPDDEVQGDYKVIVHEAMRCRRIVRDLLDYSRQQAPRRRPMDVNAVVRRTLNMVKRQPSFHDVRFKLALDVSLPKVALDANLLQQAILNLVINARDAMSARGRITIASRASRDRDQVEVAVSDTGKGIPPDLLERIFEPFFSTKGEQGNGLGLPAVRSILQQHDGDVRVESEAGQGTTFRLRLPATAGELPRSES